MITPNVSVAALPGQPRLLSVEVPSRHCRRHKTTLLKTLVVVVLQLFGISEVDSSVSSPLFKAATKIYNLAKKPKNEKSMSVNMHLQVAHGDLFLR